MKLTLIISSNCHACERAKIVLKSINLSHPKILTEFIDVNSYKKKNIFITPALLIDDILFNYGVPTVFSKKSFDSNVFMSPKELADVAIKSYLYLKKEGIKVRFFGTLPICVYGDKLQKMSEDKYISKASAN